MWTWILANLLLPFGAAEGLCNGDGYKQFVIMGERDLPTFVFSLNLDESQDLSLIEWVDLHLSINGGDFSNRRMKEVAPASQHFQLSVTEQSITENDHMSYFYTYRSNGEDCDTEQFHHGGLVQMVQEVVQEAVQQGLDPAQEATEQVAQDFHEAGVPLPDQSSTPLSHEDDEALPPYDIEPLPPLLPYDADLPPLQPLPPLEPNDVYMDYPVPYPAVYDYGPQYGQYGQYAQVGYMPSGHHPPPPPPPPFGGYQVGGYMPYPMNYGQGYGQAYGQGYGQGYAQAYTPIQPVGHPKPPKPHKPQPIAAVPVQGAAKGGYAQGYAQGYGQYQQGYYAPVGHGGGHGGHGGHGMARHGYAAAPVAMQAPAKGAAVKGAAVKGTAVKGAAAVGKGKK